jgi:ADP-ribose pyrophosphatase
MNNTSGANKSPIRTTSSRTAYETKWMRIREDKIVLPAGREGFYGVVEIDESVKVVARNDEGKLYLVENY